VLTLEGPNGGRRAVWLVHRVMRREVIKTGLHIHDHLLIQCLGMTQPRGDGRAYMNYKVIAYPPRKQEPNWARVAAIYKDNDLVNYEPPPLVEEASVTHRTGEGTAANPTTAAPIEKPSDAALPGMSSSQLRPDEDIPF